MLLQLNKDVRDEIFTYLRPCHLLHLALICKEWYGIVQPILNVRLAQLDLHHPEGVLKPLFHYQLKGKVLFFVNMLGGVKGEFESDMDSCMCAIYVNADIWMLQSLEAFKKHRSSLNTTRPIVAFSTYIPTERAYKEWCDYCDYICNIDYQKELDNSCYVYKSMFFREYLASGTRRLKRYLTLCGRKWLIYE